MATVVLGLFQLAVVAGAPLGRYVWGGQHEGKLPAVLRVGSALSLVVYLAASLVVLDRAGIAAPFGAPGFLIWVVVAFLVLGVLANLASRSPRERAVMTPLAVVLAASALIVAVSA